MTKEIKATAGSDDNAIPTANTAPPNQGPAATETVPSAEPSGKRQGPAGNGSGSVSPKRRLNALVHGVYASDLVLSWESEEDLAQLHEEFNNDLKPKGVLEKETVFALANLHWQKRRMAKASQLQFRAEPLLAGSRKLESWQDVLDEVQRGADHQAAQIQRVWNWLAKAMDELGPKISAVREQTKHDAQTEQPPASPDTSKPTQFEGIEDLRKAFDLVRARKTGALPEPPILPKLRKEIDEILVGQREIQRLQGVIILAQTEAVTRLQSPDFFQKMIKAEAAIDTRIDKTLYRLILLQERRHEAERQASTISAIPHQANTAPIPSLTQAAPS